MKAGKKAEVALPPPPLRVSLERIKPEAGHEDVVVGGVAANNAARLCQAKLPGVGRVATVAA
jgi:hypothetical protein